MTCSEDGWYIPYGEQPVDRPIRHDLVFCRHYSFENKWKSTNESVDYTAVERPSTVRLECRNWHIRRLKIVDVSRIDKLYLLRNLENSCLIQLEIDRLELVQMKAADDVLTFHFQNLEVLSIDSIVTVNNDEKELPGVRTSLRINAILLKEVHLGPHLVECISFNVAWSVQYLETDLNTGTYLAGYSNLKELHWNEIRRHNFFSIYQIVEGSICRKLKRLFLNLNKLECCSYRPENEKLEIFRQLYMELQGRMRSARKRAEPAITVFFNGVQLDFKRPFDDYNFEKTLVDMHHHNLINNRLSVIECRSVSRVDWLQLSDVLFDWNKLTPEQPFSFTQFFNLYRNIRMVVLNNLNNKGVIIKEAQFVNFLKNCTALVTLQIIHSRFTNNLYDRLVEEVKSVSTLDYFVLFEPNHSKHQINLRFLNSLVYLRYLRTNLATRSTMFELIEQMHIGAVFEFNFCRAASNDYYYTCRIERLGDVHRPRWNLLVQRQTQYFAEKQAKRLERQPFRSANITELYHKTCDLLDLKNYFLCRPNLIVSTHWLDFQNGRIQ